MADPIPPDVDVLVQRLRANVRAILGPHLVGMYLDGSLATGDFQPDKSDIDFVVVTESNLPDGLFRALRDMHARIATEASKWVTELEGSYVAQGAIRHHDPRPGPHPHIERGSGELVVTHHGGGYWVIHRHVLREHGAPLAGPAPRSLIDPVRPHHLRQAVSDIVHQWWAPMLHDPARLWTWGYRCYAVLTMCRMLYTLDHGTIVSKSAAADWVRATLDRRWARLVQDALTWSGEAAPDLNQTLALIRYTRDRSRRSRRGTEE